MDQVLNSFVNPQTVFICLVCSLVTYVIRTVVEVAAPGIKTSLIWREIWLPLGAIFVGALLGLMAKTFIWPDMFSRTVAGRMLYGALCGMFSAFVYSRVRSWVAAQVPGAEKNLPVV